MENINELENTPYRVTHWINGFAKMTDYNGAYQQKACVIEKTVALQRFYSARGSYGVHILYPLFSVILRFKLLRNSANSVRICIREPYGKSRPQHQCLMAKLRG